MPAGMMLLAWARSGDVTVTHGQCAKLEVRTSATKGKIQATTILPKADFGAVQISQPRERSQDSGELGTSGK